MSVQGAYHDIIEASLVLRGLNGPITMTILGDDKVDLHMSLHKSTFHADRDRQSFEVSTRTAVTPRILIIGSSPQTQLDPVLQGDRGYEQEDRARTL